MVEDKTIIFVIVVTFKGKRWYDRCFTSLRESTIPVQTIVVDNASNDGSAEYIRENYPEIYLIESKENLGFGRANNIGMRYALSKECNYVFLLNQDTWIENDAIEELVRIHQQHQEYGILSPMHIRADGKSLYMQILDGNKNNPNKKLISDLYCNTLNDVYPLEYVNAAAWLVPRKTLTVVGGFDPIYLHYAEDCDYSNRVLYHKLLIGLCPQARIIHDHQTTDNPLTPEGSKQRNQQMLVLECTNPNSHTPLWKRELYFVRKCVVSVCLGKINLFKKYYADLSFVVSNHKRIKKSIEMNKTEQASWL